MEALLIDGTQSYVPRLLGRHRVLDEMMTFDRNPFMPLNQFGDARGQSLGGRYRTRDSKGAFRFVDSTGAFLVGELERLDQTLHEPLVTISWSRDIDLREDVSLADEVSSFMLTTYASPGGLGTGNSIGNGKAWIGKSSNQITGIDIDLGKFTFPLNLWGMEIKYSIPELESAAKVGRPIDQQKFAGMQMKHQMDIDEQVYAGDTTLGVFGLVNQPSGVVSNVASVASVGGNTLWANKTADDILADCNTILQTTWAQTGWAIVPSRLLIPPAQFSQISMQKVSTAGNVSVLKYVQENNLLTTSGKGKLEILPCKWCIGAGSGGTLGVTGTVDRMIAYTKDKQRVRFPMTMLQRTPIQYDSIYHKTTYFCRLGVLEVVYGTSIGYRDGL